MLKKKNYVTTILVKKVLISFITITNLYIYIDINIGTHHYHHPPPDS